MNLQQTTPSARGVRIEQAVIYELVPVYCAAANESHMHNVPPGSETHLKLVVVSSAFDGMSRVNRHRRLNDLAAAEFASGLHALAIHAYTPEEWQKRFGAVPDSPNCRGGSAHDR